MISMNNFFAGIAEKKDISAVRESQPMAARNFIHRLSDSGFHAANLQ